MNIQENVAAIKQNIAHAISRRTAHVDKSPITLLAVTKNQSVAAMCEALAAGVTAIGENRVQEAQKKFAAITDAEWHLIGHLQTNKVKAAVKMFSLIHSVDSERLAVEISREASKLNKVQDVLLQVNVAEDSAKFGVARQHTLTMARLINEMPNVRLCGLMTIAPYYDVAEEVRPVFRETYRLFQQVQQLELAGAAVTRLSMGMSNDYQIAVEEGANIVRVGTGIFGERIYV